MTARIFSRLSQSTFEHFRLSATDSSQDPARPTTANRRHIHRHLRSRVRVSFHALDVSPLPACLLLRRHPRACAYARDARSRSRAGRRGAGGVWAGGGDLRGPGEGGDDVGGVRPGTRRGRRRRWKKRKTPGARRGRRHQYAVLRRSTLAGGRIRRGCLGSAPREPERRTRACTGDCEARSRTRRAARAGTRPRGRLSSRDEAGRIIGIERVRVRREMGRFRG